MQELPFEGSLLFSEQTDARLHGLKDSMATLKSLGLHNLSQPRRQYRPQQLSAITPRSLAITRGEGVGDSVEDHLHPPPSQDLLNWAHTAQATRDTHFDKILEDDIQPPQSQDPFPIFSDCLTHFLKAWKRVTSDCWVLNTVELGCG